MIKKLHVLIGVFLLSARANAQLVTIPDANFVTYLQTNFPACMTGSQMDISCTDIVSEYYVNVSGLGISDLTGIEHFTSLLQLHANNNSLSTLPALPSTLALLYIDNNQFTVCPSLTPNMSDFRCNDNDIVSLLPLPASMSILECDGNQLTSLPALPDLIFLSCSFNNLTTLPSLPASLWGLDCDNNQLTVLPVLPPDITDLTCANNMLTILPALPTSLYQFDCSGNDITNLPVLPGLLAILNVNDNPNLLCLPYLPDTLEVVGDFYGQVNITGCGINCLPNLPLLLSNPLSLPLCVSGDLLNNPNNCDEFTGIYGAVYHDTSGNCLMEPGEESIYNAAVYLLDVIGDTVAIAYTGANGAYQFHVAAGDYTILLDSVNATFDVSCAYPGIDSAVTLATSPIQNVNFAVNCSSTGHDIGVAAIGPSGSVFPGQQHTLHVQAGNMGVYNALSCYSSITGDVVVTVTGPVSYVGPEWGSLVPTTVVGNTITYSGVDLAVFYAYSGFCSVFETDTTADSLDMVCVNVLVTPTTNDFNLANNNMTTCYEVYSSYDPNTKAVSNPHVLPGYNDWLTYTIHFQNTGNAAAVNVMLKDTLDVLLHANSFDLVGSSHSVAVAMTGNVTTFKFNNIMLPDSASDPLGSIGWVQYRVKPQSGLPDGTEINNECYIYFDYNTPILTNTATTWFMADLGTPENQLENLTAYPNPSSGLFFIDLPSTDESYMIRISDMSGRLISEHIETGSRAELNLSTEENGIYIVTITNGDDVFTNKLVKY